MSLARSYTLVGSATLASRLTGFVRDVMIAAVLGTGAVADAYFVAFLLPNLFRRVLSEGAFNAAFVPIYARRRAESGEADALGFAEQALSGVLALVGLTLVITEFAMPGVIAALAPGFKPETNQFVDAVLFARIAFVFIAALVVGALLSSLLNALGKYRVVALAPLILNGVLIITLAVMLVLDVRASRQAGLTLVIMVAIAGLLQLLYVVSGLLRAEVRIGLVMPRFEQDVRHLLVLILPGLMIAGAGHVNMLVAAQMSSGIPGAVSWLYYADRIFQLPLGFVAAAIGVVLLPEVSRAIREGKNHHAHQAGCRALEFGNLLVLPAALALIILAQPIVDLLFRRGAFSADDSRATAEVLRAIAFGLPGFVLVKVFLPPFLARETMTTPIIAALAGVFINIGLTWATRHHLGHSAAAFGVAASAWVNALVLAIGLWRGRLFRVDAQFLRCFPRILSVSAGSGAVIWLLADHLSAGLAPDQSFPFRAGTLALICVLGIATQAVLAHWAGAIDIAGLPALLRRNRA